MFYKFQFYVHLGNRSIVIRSGKFMRVLSTYDCVHFITLTLFFHFLQFLNIFTVSHESHMFFLWSRRLFLSKSAEEFLFLVTCMGKKNERTECIHFRSTEIRKKCENKIFIILKWFSVCVKCDCPGWLSFYPFRPLFTFGKAICTSRLFNELWPFDGRVDDETP